MIDAELARLRGRSGATAARPVAGVAITSGKDRFWVLGGFHTLVQFSKEAGPRKFIYEAFASVGGITEAVL